MLDAAETLRRFTVDGSLDADRFVEAIGALVGPASDDGRQVQVYGEMVALLWDVGDVAGAIELERLWNELGTQLPFSLFCGYPAYIASDPNSAEEFAELCHLHSDVVATAPTPADAEATRGFIGTTQGPAVGAPVRDRNVATLGSRRPARRRRAGRVRARHQRRGARVLRLHGGVVAPWRWRLHRGRRLEWRLAATSVSAAGWPRAGVACVWSTRSPAAPATTPSTVARWSGPSSPSADDSTEVAVRAPRPILIPSSPPCRVVKGEHDEDGEYEIGGRVRDRCGGDDGACDERGRARRPGRRQAGRRGSFARRSAASATRQRRLRRPALHDQARLRPGRQSLQQRQDDDRRRRLGEAPRVQPRLPGRPRGTQRDGRPSRRRLPVRGRHATS